MRYIKFTHVDSITGVPVFVAPAANGPSFPDVVGLTYVWARESDYPTNTPEMFGTCPDDADIKVPGVLGEFIQGDWESMQADEMLARTALAPSKRITRLAFRNRFTTAEKVTLEIAGLDNPAAAMPARAQAAALRANQADLAAATFVDLDRADTRAGVQMLETAGLLAAGRAAEILDAAIDPTERPL